MDWSAWHHMTPVLCCDWLSISGWAGTWFLFSAVQSSWCLHVSRSYLWSYLCDTYIWSEYFNESSWMHLFSLTTVPEGNCTYPWVVITWYWFLESCGRGYSRWNDNLIVVRLEASTLTNWWRIRVVVLQTFTNQLQMILSLCSEAVPEGVTLTRYPGVGIFELFWVCC